MHIYRFCSPNLLSEKSLIYDELFFASTDELNDPIDMRAYFHFPKDSVESWEKLLVRLWEENHIFINYKRIAQYLSGICPIDYFEFLEQKNDLQKKILEIAINDSNHTPNNFHLLQKLISRFTCFLEIYKPKSAYAVSMSKSCANTNTLMWSHYASNHKGFCLIFKPINNKISQGKNPRTQIAATKSHICSVPLEFKLEEVFYEDDVKPIDAFSLFPTDYTGISFDNEQLRLEYHQKKDIQLRTKAKSWKYEKELRMILPQPSLYIDGVGNFKSYDRLFHYNFGQLVGIIFGARMSDKYKEKIKHIIESKVHDYILSISNTKEEIIFFDFVFQDAQLCSNSRRVKIKNIGLLSAGRYISTEEDNFKTRFDNWKQFKAMVSHKGKTSFKVIF